MSRPHPRRPRFMALAAVAVVALVAAGCGGDDDVDRAKWISDLQKRTGTVPESEEPVVPDSVAECIADAVFAEFDQAEINRIYRAAEEAELGPSLERLAEINKECWAPLSPETTDDSASNEPASDDTASNEGSEDTTDEPTTSTTEAG